MNHSLAAGGLATVGAPLTFPGGLFPIAITLHCSGWGGCGSRRVLALPLPRGFPGVERFRMASCGSLFRFPLSPKCLLLCAGLGTPAILLPAQIILLP